MRHHDVAHLDVFAPAAARGYHLQRLLAQNIGGGDHPEHLAVLVDHNQKAYTALDHAPISLFDAVAGADQYCAHLLKIGHHVDGCVIESNALRQTLARLAKSGFWLQQ